MSVALDAKMAAGNSADGLNQEASAATSISSTGITVGVGATLLVVELTVQGATVAASSLAATWNGAAMALQSTVTSGLETVAIFTLVNPASGALTLQATWANTADAYMSAASFSGTDTTTGVLTTDNTTATGTTTITVPSSTDGATVAAFCVNGAAPAVNFNKIFSEAPLNPGGGASYQLGGVSNAHTFTGAGGTAQALAGVHVIAASAATSSPPQRRQVPHQQRRAA